MLLNRIHNEGTLIIEKGKYYKDGSNTSESASMTMEGGNV